jgi:hypothetical protein
MVVISLQDQITQREALTQGLLGIPDIIFFAVFLSLSFFCIVRFFSFLSRDELVGG